MPFAIFALAAINIAVGTQGFVFGGLLPELAAALGVSVGTAGLLVAATAVTFAIASPFATASVAKIERRTVIVWALTALTAINLAATFAPSFEVLLGLRVLAGLSTAFVGALSTVAAASLVPPEMRGRAFAVVTGGLTVAFVVGVPLGTFIGSAFGWRSTFLFAAIVCGFSVLLIARTVPRIEPQPGPTASLGMVLSNRAVVRLLILTLISFAASFTITSFIGPVIATTTGYGGTGIGILQAFIGVGSLAGLTIGGILADKGRSSLVTLGVFGLMLVNMTAYWWVLGHPAGSVPGALMAVLIFSSATALFCLVPVNLGQIAGLAGAGAPLALALNGSLISLGQGIGAVWGGFLTDHAGLSAMGLGGAAIAALGLALGLQGALRRPSPAVA